MAFEVRYVREMLVAALAARYLDGLFRFVRAGLFHNFHAHNHCGVPFNLLHDYASDINACSSAISHADVIAHSLGNTSSNVLTHIDSESSDKDTDDHADCSSHRRGAAGVDLF
jgi:hypothetical protein